MKQTWSLKASFTIPNPRLAGNVPTWNPSFVEEAYPQNYMVSRNITSWTCISRSSPRPLPCQVGGRASKQKCSGSTYYSETMRWIEEVDMATSADDLKTSQSIFGHQFPNFGMFDATIASSLKKIIPNRTSTKRINPEEPKAQLDDRFLRGRQIASMIHEKFQGDRHSGGYDVT